MKRLYKAKSLAGAQRRVRELRSVIDNWRVWIKRLYDERDLLAQLAADGPCFDNPLHIAAAKKVRDEILLHMGLNPDGTRKKEKRPT